MIKSKYECIDFYCNGLNEKILLKAGFKKNQFKKIIISILSFFILLIPFKFLIVKENGYAKRIHEIFLDKIKADEVDFHQKENTKKVVLIGDSHAGSLEFNLNKEIKKKDLKRMSTFDIYLDTYPYNGHTGISDSLF